MARARKITDLTGPGHTDRFGVGGTDLGAMITAADGRIVAAFGDTFDRAGAGGPGWRSPVVLFAERGRAALRWTGASGGRRAEQIIDYRHDGKISGRRVSTILPTDVLAVGNLLYLHVMVCHGLGNVLWTQLLRSDDAGATWAAVPASWPGDRYGGLFQMLTWERGGDGWVYAFTTGFRRDAGLLLHRVPEDRIEDPGAWMPWGFRDGAWAWGNPPTIALPGAFGELSLRRLPDGWVLVAFDAGGYRIDALRLAGPLDDLHRAPRVTLLDGCTWGDEDHAAGRVAQLYGGYVVPGSTLDSLDLVVSQWNTAEGWPYRAMQFRAEHPFAAR